MPMLRYRALRFLVLALRRAQVALLNTAHFVADNANYAGQSAKTAAHAALDRQEAASYAKVRAADKAAQEAQHRWEDAIEDFQLDCDDIAITRTVIDREVL